MRKKVLFCIAIVALISCFACLFVACDGVQTASIKHTVIFDSKCDLPIQISSIENGTLLTEPNAPTKDGFEFVAWKNAKDNKTWNFAEDTVTADTVLYAEWREVEQEPELATYLVVFDSKGNEPIRFEYVQEGKKLTEPNVPNKEGFEFVAWKNAKDNKTWNFAENTVTADTVLYAEWREVEQEPELATYLVVYDSKGNEPIRFEYVEEGEKLVEPSDPTRDGYTFLCWKNAADDSEWNFVRDRVTSDTVLYAEWREIEKEPEPATYLVVFDSKGNEPVRFEYVQEGDKLVEPSDPTKDGYTFIGWKNAANDIEWNFIRDRVVADTVLYAEWQEVPEIPTCLVVFDSKSNEPIRFENVEEGEKLTEPNAPTKDGFEFVAWKNVKDNKVWNFAEDTVTADIVLYAEWQEVPEIPTYLVVFDSRGDDPICFEYVEEGEKLAEPSEPTRDGCVFLWWTNAADNSKWNFDEDVVTKNTVLYAEWQEVPEVPTYLVIFDCKGNEPIRFEYVELGEKLAAPSEPTREGYTFLCWKNSADDSEWNFDEDVITADTVIYAEWREIEKEPANCIVIIDSKNGELSQYLVVKEGEKLVEPEVYDRYGYDLTAWRNLATDEAWDFDTDTVTEATILYAEWTEWTKYHISFEFSDGTVYKECDVYEGEKITKPENPTSDDDIFDFWKDEATGEEWNFDDAVTSDIVLIVVWKPKFFVKPCNGTIVTEYSVSMSPNPSMGGQYESHTAIDFVSDDLEVYAAADGVVKQVGKDSLNGGYIVIEHSDGYVSKYYSIDDVTLEVGAQVTRGQLIGKMSDNKGTESHVGVHLHFEVTKDGKVIDPTKMMDLG